MAKKEHLKECVKIVSGNVAAAWAARYARVQVISAYPITPQTTIVEKLSDFVDVEGWDCQYVRVESEHSVMGFLVGASFAGTRTFSATSGQGLFYMNEMLHWAPPSRLPIVLAVADRGVAPGWNIWADHQDVVASRDTGWIILFASSHQEIFDTIIQAYRIGEDPKVYLPVMVCLEGFQLSHTNEPVYFPDQDLVDEYLLPLPENGWPHIFIDPDRPITFGSLQIPGGKIPTPSSMYFEFRAKIEKAQLNAKDVIKKFLEEKNRVSVSLRILDKVEPFVARRNTILMESLKEAILEVTGEPARFLRKTGTGDMNIFGAEMNVPVATYGPGNGKLSHTSCEYIEIPEYLASIQVYKRAIEKILGKARRVSSNLDDQN